MNREDLVQAEELCTYYGIELSFISELHQYGLLEVHTATDKLCIKTDHLQKLEGLIRLHYDLAINMEGLDAVSNLLEKINVLQEELTTLKNKLYFHEAS